MNGVHDLGGMHGFGEVEGKEEVPSLDDWEKSVVAISGANRGNAIFNIDEFRHGIERMDPVHYLASSYFEHWLDGMTRLLIEKGVVSPHELDARTAFFAEHADAAATAAVKGALPPFARGPGASSWSARGTGAQPRFAVGDVVRTRTMAPRGHTRLPRYARGRNGLIDAYHGVHVFPDTNAHGLGEQPQPLYSVRFTAQELWGEQAEPAETVNLDLWESYLLPA